MTIDAGYGCSIAYAKGENSGGRAESKLRKGKLRVDPDNDVGVWRQLARSASVVCEEVRPAG